MRITSILDGRKTNAEKVREFMQAFGQAVPDRPGFPDLSTVLLRHSLIAEEYREFVEALLKADIVEVADSLADLTVVVLGTAIAFGIPFEAVFTEVMNSNMSKLDENGKPIYRADGKVLKSNLYTPPDLRRVMGL